MGVTIQSMIDRAAISIGDPTKARIIASTWLNCANMALEDISMKMDLLQFEDDFDLPAGNQIPYPESFKQLVRIDVSATPSDPESFRKLDEKFEDEWNDARRGGYPTGDVPTHYFADRHCIWIMPMPVAPVSDGGIITYTAQVEEITDPSTVLPLRKALSGFVRERIEIYALYAWQRNDEAERRDIIWQARENDIRIMLEDSSLDRAEQLRPQSAKRGYGGMV